MNMQSLLAFYPYLYYVPAALIPGAAKVFKAYYVSSTQFKDRHLHDPSAMPPLHSRTRYIPPTLINAAHAHALISGPTASDPRTPLEPVRERRPEICAMITYAPSHRERMTIGLVQYYG
ncbi:hypothetical protein CSIM01_13133 [Colletotrichum simmondsii]|uniref:Uncharacterized protein n=1 Tax=Colletotrichum simmondsii TaxID=703756 RepID=A0A135RUX8_9PEZI|nr:hypothetical protein CSIM01_13133 [Colletotrichum simmondsii]